MSNVTRNTLILFVLLVVIASFFGRQIYNQNLKIEDMERALERVQRELRQYDGVVIDTLLIYYLQVKIEYMDEWSIQNSKYFLSRDDSRTTWTYLQNIINRFNPDFFFNFTVSSRSAGQNEYTLSGIALISDLYILVNHIERLGALYTIESLDLSQTFQETERGPTNFINYSINIKPWIDSSVGRDINQTPMRRIAFFPLLRDPMRPALHPPMTDPAQEVFDKHENLRLVSFTQNEAFFLDHTGRLVNLRRMQRVAYGYFSHVDTRNSRAVFRINRTGLFETIFLEMN